MRTSNTRGHYTIIQTDYEMKLVEITIMHVQIYTCLRRTCILSTHCYLLLFSEDKQPNIIYTCVIRNYIYIWQIILYLITYSENTMPFNVVFITANSVSNKPQYITVSKLPFIYNFRIADSQPTILFQSLLFIFSAGKLL